MSGDILNMSLRNVKNSLQNALLKTCEPSSPMLDCYIVNNSLSTQCELVNMCIIVINLAATYDFQLCGILR